ILLPILTISETAGTIRFESKTSSKTISDIREGLFAWTVRETVLLRTAVDLGVTRIFSRQSGIKSTNSTKNFLTGLAVVSIRSFSILMRSIAVYEKLIFVHAGRC